MIILLHKTEEKIAKILGNIFKSLNPALEINVLLMAFGDLGHLGHLVLVTAKSQDLGYVTNLLQQMEENLVLVTVKSLRHVQMVNV